MAGFILGICSANIWMKEYVLDIGIFQQYFLEQYSQTDIVYRDYLWYLTKSRGSRALLLFAAAGTRYKKPAVLIVTLWLGFCFGMTTSVAVMKMGLKGIILIIMASLPQGIFYGMAGIILLGYMLEYPMVRWNAGKSLKVGVLLTAGLLTECYVGPVILKVFLKTI